MWLGCCIFDKKETGKISKEDFCRIMNTFGHELIKLAVFKLETTLNILFQRGADGYGG